MQDREGVDWEKIGIVLYLLLVALGFVMMYLSTGFGIHLFLSGAVFGSIMTLITLGVNRWTR